jgi:hypothetical protein
LIKGHTKIELTNVKTGQKKVVEDTNMLTNGMSNFLMSNPFNYTPINVGYRPFSTEVPRSYQLCGGLLLFEKPIKEDPDMIFPPSGNKMIGNSVAGISSGNAIPEFGYFDANNSTFEYSGDTTTQKFVFDFSTSQGNGQISSVCLASLLAGYMGFGNHSGQRVAETVGNLKFGDPGNFNPFYSSQIGHSNLIGYYPKYRRNDELNDNGYPFLFNYEKNCVYICHTNSFYRSSTYADEHFSSGTLKLQKYYFPLSSWNPLGTVCSSSSFSWDYDKYQNCEVEIPSEITGLQANVKNYRNQVFNSYDGTYLIIGNRDSDYLEANDNIYVLHVNADLESKLYTVKNTTGKRIKNVQSGSSNSVYDFMAVKDGYLYCQQYSNSYNSILELFKIKLTDSTDVVSLGTLNSSHASVKFSLLSDRIFIHNDYYDSYSYGNVYAQYIIDDAENVILPVNSNFKRHNKWHLAICGCKFMYYTQDYFTTGNTYYGYLMFNPMYLATINNLPEPVLKTADLTMKITYTLTCTEEGGGQEGDS